MSSNIDKLASYTVLENSLWATLEALQLMGDESYVELLPMLRTIQKKKAKIIFNFEKEND